VNVFALRWIGSSDRLLIATQVYPASDCGKDMGLTLGYTVQLDDGSIIERHSRQETEDEIKKCPTLIWPTALWDDRMLQQAKSQTANPNQP
jgi:hypothetical protein